MFVPFVSSDHINDVQVFFSSSSKDVNSSFMLQLSNSYYCSGCPVTHMDLDLALMEGQVSFP